MSTCNINKKAHKNSVTENQNKNIWITGGYCGSRDAVVVFRTDALANESESSVKKEVLIIEDEETRKHISSCLDPNVCCFCDSSSNIIASLTPTSKLLPKDYFWSTDLKCCKTIESADTIVEEGNQKQKIPCKQPALIHIVSRKALVHSADIDDNPQTMKETQLEFSMNAKNKTEDIDDENSSNLTKSDMVKIDASKLQISFKFYQTETKLLKKIFDINGLLEAGENENFCILWTGVHIKPDILRNLLPYQRVNHFPRSYEITRKDRIYKNIECMQQIHGLKHFDIVPQSFVLPLEYKSLVSSHNKCRGPWIVKPAASSRGRGIFIVNSPDQIPQDEQVLVSKYVADPLCIDGHKCDLRLYVLVTSFDPLIIYVYEEGLVRLATVKYDSGSDNLWNPCMHLCNYSINKYHTDYIKSSDPKDEDVGHKWTLSALLRHLKSQGCDTLKLMMNIEDLIIKSILSCAQSIISACRMFVPSGNNCFELYGYDILIDDSLKPWLLEVNLSPSMGVDTPLDAKVKSSLMTDLLTCIGIPAYTPSVRAYYDNKWTRFRNLSRKTFGPENVSASNLSSRKGSINSNMPLSTLTLEEQRIIRNARLQNRRRGGFVRIFPTEDLWQRYGIFFDVGTGIPISSPMGQSQISFSKILPSNHNQMLFNSLYGDDGKTEGNSFQERMEQYERGLETNIAVLLNREDSEKTKCVEAGKRLKVLILKLINNKLELTQLQARRAFALYIEAVLNRLATEHREYHERLIIKFLNRIGGAFKTPFFFRNPANTHDIHKARSAMLAKLLGDFLEQYNKDTEAYVDSFDHYGMIPSNIYNEFLSHALEEDLESVLTLHTNITGTMPYLYNRCGLSVPPTPPIPSGRYGFLRALPTMVVSGSGSRDFNKYESYYRNYEKDCLKIEKQIKKS